jgi:hypothetical protein
MSTETNTIELDGSRSERIRSREWTAERVGWFVIAAILIAALLGLLGPGLLSYRIQTSPDHRLSVEYYAVQRYDAPAELRIRFRPSDVSMVRITVARTFTDQTTPESITPNPETVEMQGDRLVYSFRAMADHRAAGLVTYRYKSNVPGWLRYEIGLDGGPSIEVSQFVCP